MSPEAASKDNSMDKEKNSAQNVINVCAVDHSTKLLNVKQKGYPRAGICIVFSLFGGGHDVVGIEWVVPEKNSLTREEKTTGKSQMR